MPAPCQGCRHTISGAGALQGWLRQLWGTHLLGHAAEDETGNVAAAVLHWVTLASGGGGKGGCLAEGVGFKRHVPQVARQRQQRR